MLTAEKYSKAHLLRDLRDIHWRIVKNRIIALFVMSLLNNSVSRLLICAQICVVTIVSDCLLHGFNGQIKYRTQNIIFHELYV